MHSAHTVDNDNREWRFFHNGDWSGRVLIDVKYQEGQEDAVEWITGVDEPSFHQVSIPFEVLAEIVGRAFQDAEIERLEDELGRDYLKRITGLNVLRKEPKALGR